jgi:uncharacterized protein (DUF1330 family)
MDEYQKYLDGFDVIFQNYKGEVVSVEENPTILEGEWDFSRLVIIRFSSETEAKKWYNSSEYQSLLQHRLNSAKGTILLINDRLSD